jgi:hypothetical protein
MAHGQIVGQFSAARSGKRARKWANLLPDTRPGDGLRGEIFTFGLIWGNVTFRPSLLTVIR